MAGFVAALICRHGGLGKPSRGRDLARDVGGWCLERWSSFGDSAAVFWGSAGRSVMSLPQSCCSRRSMTPGERGMAIPLAEPFGHSTWDRGEGLFAEAPRDGGIYLCDCAGSDSDPRTPALCLEYVRSSVTDVFGHHQTESPPAQLVIRANPPNKGCVTLTSSAPLLVR